VHGPWGKWGHIECGEKWGTRPAKRGGKQTVGIRQWRMLDVSRCWTSQGTGWAQHESSLMHRVRIICVICALICYSPDSYDRKPCLTVSICFRRINHMAVKNHFHSSSGVREVVSGTSITMQFDQPHLQQQILTYSYCILNSGRNLTCHYTVVKTEPSSEINLGV
jgi:hypothetical protein